MRPSPPPARGILRHATPSDGETEHHRVLPALALAPFVAHFWSVRWDLRAPFVAETLPHPSVHVTFERTSVKPAIRAQVLGVATGRFRRTLEGEGMVFGIKFRPAAFQPLLKASMTSLTDRRVAIGTVLGAEGRALGHSLVLRPGSFDEAIDQAETFLARVLPALPDEVLRVRDLVERLAIDRSLLRVEDAAAVLGVDVRTLQRRFATYVGVSPKWVIRRYRLHEAAEQLALARPPALAALAASLGYFDQSHFVRDFKATVGHAPGQFRSRARSGALR